MALAALGWLALLVAAPVLPVPAAGVLYLAGSFICHQLPDRSFHLAGVQLPVCARCIGIYAGLFACLCVQACGLPWTRPGSLERLRMVVTAGMIPTALSVGLEWAGLWHPSNA